MTITGSSSGATGTSMVLGSIIPDLVGKFLVMGHNPPHVKLSCVEMNVKLKKCADYEMIRNSVRSCFFDADAGVTLKDSSFKIFAWFNHERSYGQRCTDMILHMAQAPLLPGLPDDLATACLIWLRVPPKELFILRTVSRRWRRVLTGSYYNSLPKKLGITE